MKQRILSIAFAVLAIGLLGSCLKINERLDNLDKRVDEITSDKIAKINDQIASINSSISDLNTIRTTVQALANAVTEQGKDITALEASDEAIFKSIEELHKADAALGERIDDLTEYVKKIKKVIEDVDLDDYAQKTWVEATFSTLEQYESTCETIAEVKEAIAAANETIAAINETVAAMGGTLGVLAEDIEELDGKIDTEIEKCVSSMKVWVNERLSNYYTVAQADAKVASLQEQISKSDSCHKARIDSLAGELTSVKVSIDTAKKNLREEYRSAISAAISKSEGKLTKDLKDAIEKVNVG